MARTKVEAPKRGRPPKAKAKVRTRATRTPMGPKAKPAPKARKAK